MSMKEIARELQGKVANLALRMPISWVNILAGPPVGVDGRTLDGRSHGYDEVGVDLKHGCRASPDGGNHAFGLPGLGAGRDFAPAVEWVFFAFGVFLRDEFSALRDGGVLGLGQVQGPDVLRLGGPLVGEDDGQVAGGGLGGTGPFLPL